MVEKGELHAIADRLPLKDPTAISDCIRFIEADSKGLGHGRVRALMCRRLKHCPLSPAQRGRLVTCIAERLCTGRFSEQFHDQLRLALRLDAPRLFAAAHSCMHHSRDYVRRYAGWILSRLPLANNHP